MGFEHVLAFRGDNPIPYLRVVPAGVAFPEPAIGRGLTLPEARGQGVRRALMQQALGCLLEHGPIAVSLSAQAQLLNWYLGLGFEPTSDAYVDAGIPHVSMRRAAVPL